MSLSLTPTRGFARAGALVAVLAFGLAACSSGSTPAPTVAPAASSPAAASASPSAASQSPAAASASASSGGASANAVTIQGFAFNPATITVATGTTVTWTNKDNTSHTVTADDGSFDSKPVASGATFTMTFSKAGTFAYHCTIHPSMKATIVVQ